MGSCFSKENNNRNRDRDNYPEVRNNQLQHSNTNRNTLNGQNSFYNIDSIDKINKKYDYLYKLINNEYQGEGILKTNKYISYVNENELNIKRDEFWETNINGNIQVRNSLKLLFETKDVQNFKAILIDLGVTFKNNTCQICYDKLGNSYLIPAFVINNPSSYEINDGKNLNFTEKNYKIELKNIYDSVTKSFNSSTLIKEIIEFLIAHFKVDTSKYQLKLVYKGIIFEEKDKLGYYINKDDEVIQIFNLEII